MSQEQDAAVLAAACDVVRGWHPPTPERMARIAAGVRAGRSDNYETWLRSVVGTIRNTFVAKLDAAELGLRAKIDHELWHSESGGEVPESCCAVLVAWDAHETGQPERIPAALLDLETRGALNFTGRLYTLFCTLKELGRRATGVDRGHWNRQAEHHRLTPRGRMIADRTRWPALALDRNGMFVEIREEQPKPGHIERANGYTIDTLVASPYPRLLTSPRSLPPGEYEVGP